VPGVAKDAAREEHRAAFDMRFSRLQFTPDLMPSDVIGQTLLDQSSGGLSVRFPRGRCSPTCCSPTR